MKRKLSVLVLLASIMATQSGCIVGGIFWPIGWPVFVAGAGVTTIGAIVGGVGLGTGDIRTVNSGASLIGLGIILGNQDPGRNNALNTIPRSLSKTIGVTERDITTYNDHISRDVRAVFTGITQDIGPIVKKVMERGRAGYDLAKDEAALNVAKKYGFDSIEDMVTSLSSAYKGTPLPVEKLNSFAGNTGLSTTDARILLYTGYGISVAKE